MVKEESGHIFQNACPYVEEIPCCVNIKIR